ncbi:adhesion G protein-coupled receptor E1-like [Odocoileus virginianus]|uniref:Adhesion G protein-coupled receptor E1-like n=1 Tax=Odocoileus virginianus TaxID=9874 RepID=A0ABM4HDJ6_ODOVR
MARSLFLPLRGLSCLIFFLNIPNSSFQVTDVNECLDTQACPSKATCTDTVESYFCTCKSGYESSNGKIRFNGPRVTCEDKNECLNPALCSPTARCKNTRGSYLCVCDPGFETADGRTEFTGSGGTCIRINPRSSVPTQVTFTEAYRQQVCFHLCKFVFGAHHQYVEINSNYK